MANSSTFSPFPKLSGTGKMAREPPVREADDMVSSPF